jgi:hypothetical protein
MMQAELPLVSSGVVRLKLTPAQSAQLVPLVMGSPVRQFSRTSEGQRGR